MAVLFSRIEEEMDCPKEVVIWNYWDREHLTGTHYLHYENARVIAEKGDWCLSEFEVKIPFIPLRVLTRNFAYMESPVHMRTIHIGKLSMLEQDFYFQDQGPTACKVVLENRIRLPMPEWMANLLMPLWRKFSRKWFYATWIEDVPMRHRRWRVWQLGFRDFVGVDYINQKKMKPADRGKTIRLHPVELPLKKSTPIKKEGWPRIKTDSIEMGYETNARNPKSPTNSSL